MIETIKQAKEKSNKELLDILEETPELINIGNLENFPKDFDFKLECLVSQMICEYQIATKELLSRNIRDLERYHKKMAEVTSKAIYLPLCPGILILESSETIH